MTFIFKWKPQSAAALDSCEEAVEVATNDSSNESTFCRPQLGLVSASQLIPVTRLGEADY